MAVLPEEVPTDRSSGMPYPITDEWRTKARARMLELGITKADLHRRLQCSDATISHILGEGDGPRSKATVLMPAIHRILQWPPPALPEDSIDDDPVRNELAGIYDAMTEEQRSALLGVAKVIGDKKKKSDT